MSIFNYRGYIIKHEYSGWGVTGIMFDEKDEAKDWIDRQIDGQTVESSIDGYGNVTT